MGTVVIGDGMAGMTALKIAGKTDELTVGRIVGKIVGLIAGKIGNLIGEKTGRWTVARIAGKIDKRIGGKTAVTIGSRIARTIAGQMPVVNCVGWTGPILWPETMVVTAGIMPVKSRWTGTIDQSGWKEPSGMSVWNA